MRQLYALALIGFLAGVFKAHNEYHEFSQICHTLIPSHPVKFNYKPEIIADRSSNEGVVLGLYEHDKKLVTLALHGSHAERRTVLYHELGHAAMFHIMDAYPDIIYDLYHIFILINVHEYGSCTDYNWESSYTSLYGCSAFIEDVAELYSNVMSPYLPWNHNTRAKAEALCGVYAAFGVPCALA